MFVSIGNACMWHWVWWVDLSGLQTVSFVTHPPCPCVVSLYPSSSFVLCMKPSVAPSPSPYSFTHQNKESCLFGSQESGLTDYFPWVTSSQPHWTYSVLSQSVPASSPPSPSAVCTDLPLELWLVWTPLKQGLSFSPLVPEVSTGIDIQMLIFLVGRRQRRPTRGVHTVEWSRHANHWRHLGTIRTDLHGFQVPRWIVKIAFPLSYTTSAISLSH